MSGQLHAPAALPPEKSPRYPFYRRFGGPQNRSGRYGEVKIFTLPGLELPPHLVIQPVASHYTDWAIPAHIKYHEAVKKYIIRNFITSTSRQILLKWTNQRGVMGRVCSAYGVWSETTR
jgi:hypothetical protein